MTDINRAEALSNALATLETLMAHYGSDMPEGDRIQRERILAECKSAQTKRRDFGFGPLQRELRAQNADFEVRRATSSLDTLITLIGRHHSERMQALDRMEAAVERMHGALMDFVAEIGKPATMQVPRRGDASVPSNVEDGKAAFYCSACDARQAFRDESAMRCNGWTRLGKVIICWACGISLSKSLTSQERAGDGIND